jgi:hypothetical protein
MIRLTLIPALLAAGPALAHTARHTHFHETDMMSAGMGLLLIAAAVGAGLALRGRNR